MNKYLIKLIFSGNKIGSDGCEVFLKSLNPLRHLSELNLNLS
mgnify:CR=1 FL=1